MNERIPILYDMALRPEWIDFALEQYIRCSDAENHRVTLRDYLSTQLQGKEAVIKTASQLQRNAGPRSVIAKERLEEFYEQMRLLPPAKRNPLRLQILIEATPFFADCVSALRRFKLLGMESIEIGLLNERLVARYGERDTVFRRVHCVLRTLTLLGMVEYKHGRWFLNE